MKKHLTWYSWMKASLISKVTRLISFQNTKQRLGLVTKELEELRWENEVLELRFEKVPFYAICVLGLSAFANFIFISF